MAQQVRSGYFYAAVGALSTATTAGIMVMALRHRNSTSGRRKEQNGGKKGSSSTTCVGTPQAALAISTTTNATTMVEPSVRLVHEPTQLEGSAVVSVDDTDCASAQSCSNTTVTDAVVVGNEVMVALYRTIQRNSDRRGERQLLLIICAESDGRGQEHVARKLVRYLKWCHYRVHMFRFSTTAKAVETVAEQVKMHQYKRSA